MIKIDGRFTVRREKGGVLGFFRDVEQVAKCLPGLQEVKAVEEGGATVVVKAGVSFIRGPLTVKLRRVQDDEHAIVYRAHASGLSSVVDIEAEAHVEDSPQGETAVSWHGAASVGGTLASLASGMLEPVMRQNLKEFVGNLQAALEGRA